MIFDKTRVCVHWSESLVGTYSIFADNLKQLESFVLGHYPVTDVGRVLFWVDKICDLIFYVRILCCRLFLLWGWGF